MEKNKIEHRPKYFDVWKNPEDPAQVYYKYNGKYFEEDRPRGEWSRLPDIYGERLPPEVEEFERNSKKK